MEGAGIDEDDTTRRRRPCRTVVNATPPGVVAVQGYGLASIAGDEDNFGYGPGWVPPQTCEVFDNRGPEDLGVFDQREPTPGKYDSICTFSGGWQQSFTVPAGGVGQFTVTMRILGSEGAATTCFFSPCGCTTANPQLFINGVPQPGFFSDPGCAHITEWSKTFQGADAAIAAGGALNFQVNWNNGAFAIDWSKVSDVLPIVNIQLLDGDGQKAVTQNAAEKKLRVKLSCADPSTPVAGMGVTFTVTNHPPKAAKYGVGADDKATTTTYGATADANGIASAVIVAGDVEGQYTVEAKTSLATSGPVTFTTTAQKPDSTAILKDSTDIADKADTYAVSSEKPTKFYVAGLDKSGQKIGPMKCDWSVTTSGNGATRGGGSVAPTTAESSTSFTPSTVGQVALSAKPSGLKGVPTGKADLYITSLYVAVDNAAFSITNPVDQRNQFVPGVAADGTDVPLAAMAGAGQTIGLHVLTGPGAKGKVTFTVASSSFPGIAMNYPINNPGTDPDMAFGTTNTTTVNFASGGDTYTLLNVRDYGAIGAIGITITSGKNTYALSTVVLPADNGSGLPAAGWPTVQGHVDASGLTDTDDIDSQPYSQTGDCLSNFEEYRGFVAASTHIRTNPRQHDIFVVADPQLLVSIIPMSAITATLPSAVHYLDLSEVTGEDYSQRAILKGKAVVDPNRAGIAGARQNGQRAARVVLQTAFPPNELVQTQPGIYMSVPVWQAGTFGATILDTTNPDLISQTTTGGPQTFLSQSPDATRWSEVYERTFTNGGIATDFANLLYLDANGQPVPPCPSAGTIAGCDEYDYAHHLVLPRINPGGIFVLHSVPYPGDWYSQRVVTCADTTNILDYGFTNDEMLVARGIVGAHEMGHSLHIDHTLDCGNLMFDFSVQNFPHVGMIDIHPLPIFYSGDETAQIQLHP